MRNLHRPTLPFLVLVVRFSLAGFRGRDRRAWLARHASRVARAILSGDISGRVKQAIPSCGLSALKPYIAGQAGKLPRCSMGPFGPVIRIPNDC
jgi:hypothetical protein